MSQNSGEARQFTQGSILLSRLSKAEIGEKSYLHLETAMDYLTLNGAEAARLADFLRDQSTYPLIAERLSTFSRYAQEGVSERVGLLVLFETVASLLPKAIAEQVQEIITLLDNRTEQTK